MRYRICLIGPFGLFTPGGERIDIRSRKAIALLGLLAMAPSGLRTRVWLQTMLWGSRGTAQAQSSLRRELSNLSGMLRKYGAEHLLLRESQRVQLQLDWLEIDVHNLALTSDRGLPAAGGDFLEGIDFRDCDEFDEWLRNQRDRVSDLLELSIPDAPAKVLGAEEILGGPLPERDGLPAAQPPIPPRPSVVVLPFAVHGDDAEKTWIGESQAESISILLCRFPQLFVIASMSGLALVERRMTPKEISSELGVRYLLTGSVREHGDGRRVSAQLLDGPSGQQIWARTFVSRGAELADLDEEIALAVAPQIWTQIDLAERHRGIVQPILDPSSYALYWRANALFREWKREPILEAVQLTDELVAINPHCALSAALAAFCNAIAFNFGWTVNRMVSRRAAIAHFQNALRLGGDNVEALGYAAGTIILIGGDARQADRIVNHALSLLPAYQPTLFWGGWVDVATGNSERARERFELSLRINPASGVRAYALAGIGLTLLLEGDPAGALKLLEPAAVEMPDFIVAHAALACAAVVTGATAVAVEAALRVKQLGGFVAATEFLRGEAHRALLERGLKAALASAD